MHNSMTRLQECALAVIALSVLAIAIATPFATLGAGTSWRAKAASGLTMLETLITVMKRMLGL